MDKAPGGTRASRRTLIKAGAAAGIATWATPTILSTPALAQGTVAPDLPGPLYGISGSSGSGGGALPNNVLSVAVASGTVQANLDLGLGPFSNSIGSDGNLLYVLRGSFDTTFVFESIDPVDSTVTPITLSADPIGEAGALTWNGTSFYVVDSGQTFAPGFQLYTLTTGGVLTTIGSTGQALKGLAVIGGVLYAVSPRDANLYTVDTTTAALTNTGAITSPSGTVTQANGLTIDPVSGTVYVLIRLSGSQTRQLATLDVATRVATVIGPVETDPATGVRAVGLAWLA